MPEVHISVSAEKLFEIWGLPVTNSLLTTWIVMILLAVFSLYATKKLSLVPGKLQTIAEIIVGGLYSLFEGVLHQNAKRFFTLLATIFIFIMAMNWSGLIPGVGTVGVLHTEEETTVADESHEYVPPKEEFVPLFRAGTADLNTTIALALIAVFSIQYTGIKTLKLGYLKKFINLSNPINFFVGILELVSEASRVLSFAFRLFGNVFAGEVLLTVIAVLVPFFAPLPFLGLELFVGFIQALVFSMLTAVLLQLSTQHAEV